MSSSFVKDCSDASRSSSSNNNKTVIIIVNNEAGNVPFYSNELQNLLASHGADPSQVSVVQMGTGGGAVSTLPTSDLGANFGGIAGLGASLNFMLEGYSAIPLEGSTIGGYAELPLDADALQRLESVLETEEAKQILGEPLLNIVNDPNALEVADELDSISSSLSSDIVDDNSNIGKKKRPPPKRRSQRQMDKAEREEVEKILAENQLMLRREREELLRKTQEEEEEKAKAEEGKEEKEDEQEEEKENETAAEMKGKGKSTCLPSAGGRGKVMKKGVEGKKINKKVVGGEKKIPKKGEGGGKKIPKKGEGTNRTTLGQKKVVGKKILIKREESVVKKVTPKGDGGGGKKAPKKDKAQGGKKTTNKDEGKKIIRKTTKKDSNKENKGVKMKELSVKVKKLNEKLLKGKPPGTKKKKQTPQKMEEKEEEELSSREVEEVFGNEGLTNELVSSSITESGKLLNLEESSDKSDSLVKTATTATDPCITEKGSNHQLKLAVNQEIKTISSESSLSKVQSTVVNQIASNKLDFNSSNYELELDTTSEANNASTNQISCADSNNLSDEASDNLNVDAKTISSSLMPTQNFSDKAGSAHSQMESLQVKSPKDCRTRLKESPRDLPLLSEVKEIRSNVNKLTKNVEVLNPKEKNEVYVLSSVIAKNLKENSEGAKVIHPPNSSFKKIELKQAADDKKASKANTQSLADKKKGKGGSENNHKNQNLKEEDRENAPPKLLSQSPSISKSLMNYKIPLKNSVRRPSINPKGQSKLPGNVTLLTHDNSQSQSQQEPISQHTSASAKSKATPLSANTKNTATTIAHATNKNTTPTTTKPINPVTTQTPSFNTDTQIPPLTKPKIPLLNRNNPLGFGATPNFKGTAVISHPNNPNPTNFNSSNTNFNPQNQKIHTVKSTKIKNLSSIENSIIRTIPEDIKLTKTLTHSVKHPSESHGTWTKDLKGSHSPKKTKDLTLSRNLTVQPFSKLHGKLFLPAKKRTMSATASEIRRSGRPIKKKTFGDDILFLDEKTFASDEEKLSDEDSDENSSEDKAEIRRSESEDSNNSEEEEDGGEDDDPERLWCICQRPHNNRFMICCDRCEDWFHGSCVGITKPMGRQMEEEGREWICPNCRKAERAIKGIASPLARKEVDKGQKHLENNDIKITKIIENKKDKTYKVAKKQIEKKPKEKTEPRVLVYEKATGIVLSGTSAPTLNILADWLKSNPAFTTLQPAMMNSIKYDPKTGIKRINLEEFGLKPEKPPKPDRRFSFQEKIDSGSPPSGAKKEKNRTTKLLKQSEMAQLESARRLSESSADAKHHKTESPKKKGTPVNTFYKERKNSFEKGETPRKNSLSELGRSNSSDDNQLLKKSHKESPKEHSKKVPIKSPEIDKVVMKSDIMKVRNSVKNMLFDALEKRRSEVKSEFENLTEEDLKELCKEIEEHLFLYFNKDVGFKYKSRYRSLVFNIRDTKNSGLFRKILNRTIVPEKMASMTSEEFASKELAEWREREEKKELEAIQKHELERIALGDQYIMKSHKGEIVIDKDEFPSKSKDTESVISLAPDPSKVLPAPDPVEDEAATNHKNHIYDPACKICTANDPLLDLSSTSIDEISAAVKEEISKKLEEESDKERRRRSSEGRRESESHHHHHSKHKKKDRERHHSHKSRDRDRDRHRDRDKDRDKDSKDRDKDSDRDKDRDREKDRNRDKDNDKDRDRRHRHERYSRDDRREDRKRRHSGSRKEDSKRRDSETSHGYSSHKRRESEEESKAERKENKENEGENMLTISNGQDIPPSHPLSPKEEGGTPPRPSLENHVVKKEEDETSTSLNSKLDSFELPLPPTSTSVKSDDEENSISLTPPPLPPPEDSPPSYSSPDRSPSTPPLPVDIEGEEDLLSPATPPLPDEDRLTPPPQNMTVHQPPRHVENIIQMPIWKGIISMPDVAKFSAAAFEVSGKALFFTGDVPSVVEVVGRINPDTVWSYIAQMKKSGSKEILVIRFQPSSEEEKVSYIALYSYLSSKKRYGVIGNCEKSVKDFYIVPLASHQPIPQVLLPLDGPGFEESRPHMLIGVIVRTKHRRIYDPLTGSWTNISEPPQHRSTPNVTETDTAAEDDSERSYTPPPTVIGAAKKPGVSKPHIPSADDDDDLEELFTPSPLSTDGTSIPPLPVVADRSSDGVSSSERESMLAELNRQIERDKKELCEMQRRMEEKGAAVQSNVNANEKDEGDDVGSGRSSSPSKERAGAGDEPLEGESVNGSSSAPLDKIRLPSNLHEILASIKAKEEAIREKEDEIKRRMGMAEAPEISAQPPSGDIDLRLVLGTGGKDQDMRILGPGARIPPTHPASFTGVNPRAPPPTNDQDFRSRDPRIPSRDAIPSIGEGASLSAMSDADLVAKAIEMEIPNDLGGNTMYPRGHETPLLPHRHALDPIHGPRISHEGEIPPNPSFSDHRVPPPGYQPPVPYANPTRLPGGLPPLTPMDHPPLPHGPPFPSGSSHYEDHRPDPPMDPHLPLRGHSEEYTPYPHPGMDQRRSRRDEGRLPRRGNPWEHRGGIRDSGYWGEDDSWDRDRGWDRSSGGWYDDGGRGRKRRWKDGGRGGPPPMGHRGDEFDGRKKSRRDHPWRQDQ